MGVGDPLRQLQKLLGAVWGKWDIQTIVMASLVFQGLLVLLGPMRKTKKSAVTLLPIWFIYLIAEYFATFAIGLINSSDASNREFQIAAFWAAFLLLHLGGPHTITSFATEDNDLWHRHLLTLIVQVLSVLLVFYRSKIYLNRELLAPTLIVFVIGIVKYAERTRSLYLASQPIMRRSMRKEKQENPGDETEHDGRARDLEANTTEQQLDEVEILYKGYKYYRMFRGFIVDHTFIHIIESDEAKKDFLKLGYDQAFKVMEVELNFMYDAMFTKMAAVQWISWFGYLYRFVLHIALVVVTVMFFYRHKRNIHLRDISISYTLLGGAVVLDIIAMVKLVFSEWTIAIMKDAQEKHKREGQQPNKDRDLIDPRGMFNVVRKWVLCVKRNETIIRIVNFIKNRISSKLRWSKQMKQYSLLNHSLNSRWEWVDKILDQCGLTEKIDSCQYTKLEPVERSLRKVVFEYIKKEAELHHTTELAAAAESGGETKAEDNKDRLISQLSKICSTLETKYYNDNYDIHVLTLHVATEICYYAIDEEGEEIDQNRETCKNISEYLAYLLVVEGKITSAVPGNVGMRFRDICWEEVEHTRQELISRLRSKQPPYSKYMIYMLKSTWVDVKDFFTNLRQGRNKNGAGKGKRVRTRREQHIRRWEDRKRREASERLLWEVGDEEGRCSGSKSVLKEAVLLAKDLKRFSDHHVPKAGDGGEISRSKEMWKFVSEMWVKLLLFAGSHCRGDVHYLNKGGELLTFVRLMLAHSGLRERFKDEAQVDAQINRRKVPPTSNTFF